jgi:hypothetical protein
MQVAQGLTSHTVVLVVEKRERGIASQTFLTKLGFKVVVALGLYEALKFVEQEMPHLVISEVTLTDGTCVHLFDKLQQNKLLSKTPIMAYSVKKTPDEVAVIKSRKFAGAYAGAIEPKTFFQAVMNIINQHSAISPYYFGASQCGLVEDLTLKVESMVMGRMGDQILMKGANEVDQNASMLCVPRSQEMAPAILRMATNMKNGEEVFNLFPISRAVGKGRIWMDKLPIINLESAAGGATKNEAAASSPGGSPRRVIFYDPNEARAEQFKQILAGYDIEILYTKSLGSAAQMLMKSPDSIGGVYLHELMNDATSAEWKNAYAKIPASNRPPIICGTTMLGAKSTDSLRYIKRPFGMGVLVEMMESTFTRAGRLSSVVGTSSGTSSSGMPVSMQAPAKLVGLDETGGVLQMKFPIAKGSKVEIVHEFVQGLLGGSSVTIVAAAALPSQPDVYQARFESIGAGLSKAKYWEKISKVLEEKALKISQAAAAATPPAA